MNVSNNNEFELEDMRQQLNTLKKKLDQQEIVNDRLMRLSMKKEVNKITRRYYIIMAAGILMVPYGYWVFVKLCHVSGDKNAVERLFAAGDTYISRSLSVCLSAPEQRPHPVPFGGEEDLDLVPVEVLFAEYVFEGDIHRRYWYKVRKKVLTFGIWNMTSKIEKKQ